MKVMPECHKKKFDFLWKNKFEKRLVFRKSRIFSFEVSSGAEKSIWVKQVDGVGVNGLASDFGENIRQ